MDALAEAERCFTEDGRELETLWSRVWLAAALSSAGEAGAVEKFKSLLSGRGPASHALTAAFRLARPWLGRLKSDPNLGRAAGPLFLRADQLEARLPGLRRNLRRLPQAVTLSAPRLTIPSLGWTKVTVNGQPAEWPTQSVRELFFYFLASPKSLSKERVADSLWADTEDPERLKQRFKNEIYRLRRVVGLETITLDGELYRFNRSLDYDYDLDDFETYLARAKSAETDDERIVNYEKAMELMKGPYLADIGAVWAILDRERIQQIFLDAALRLAGLYLERGRAGSALDACQRALEIDPANESAHLLAMRSHAAHGDRAAIVRQYQTCREALEHLFGLPPSEETEKLYRQLIA
jgi:two-component SAPR family response regulator